MSRNIGPLLASLSPANAYYAANSVDFSTILTLAAEGMSELHQLSKFEHKTFQANLDFIMENNVVLTEAIAERTLLCAENNDMVGIQMMIITIMNYNDARPIGPLSLMFTF